MLLCYRLPRIKKSKRKSNIEAPLPPRIADQTAPEIKFGDTAWNEKSKRMKVALAHLDECVTELEERIPSKYQRRTFPGQQVVIDAGNLPSFNHNAIKQLRPEQTGHSEDIGSNDDETLPPYSVGREPETMV